MFKSSFKAILPISFIILFFFLVRGWNLCLKYNWTTGSFACILLEICCAFSHFLGVTSFLIKSLGLPPLNQSECHHWLQWEQEQPLGASFAAKLSIYNWRHIFKRSGNCVEATVTVGATPNAAFATLASALGAECLKTPALKTSAAPVNVRPIKSCQQPGERQSALLPLPSWSRVFGKWVKRNIQALKSQGHVWSAYAISRVKEAKAAHPEHREGSKFWHVWCFSEQWGILVVVWSCTQVIAKFASCCHQHCCF